MRVTVETAKEKMEAKKNEFVDDVKFKAKQAANWANNNPDKVKAAIPIVTAAVCGGTKIITNAQRAYNKKAEEEAKYRSVYDPSNGQYLKLKRAMTTSEKIQLDSLRHNGYSVTKALDIMGLLE